MKPNGRSLSDFNTLQPAEKILLDCCRRGGIARITDARPVEANAENTVRAGFLRFLLLGGDEQAPVHEHGIQLHGAYIEDELNLKTASVRYAISLIYCTLAQTLEFTDTKFEHSVVLNGCGIPGLRGQHLVAAGTLSMNSVESHGSVSLEGAQINGQLNCSGASFDGKGGPALSADGAVVKEGVFLGEGFNATGTVRLLGAQIGGALDCYDGSFNGAGDLALSADGAVVNGDVFLCKSFRAIGTARVRGFNAIGTVRLLGVQIDGQLNCDGGSFNGNGRDALLAEGVVVKGDAFLRQGFEAIGKVNLNGAQLLGDLKCYGASFKGRYGDTPSAEDEDVTLSAKGMRVDGTLVLCELKLPLKNASFAGAKVAVLNDDEQAWGDNLVLNGFVYGFLDASAPVRAASRRAWLDKQVPSMAGSDGLRGSKSKFCPQPWRQLQHVLEGMGHAEEAFEIGIAFERRLRQVGLIGQATDSWPKWKRWLYFSPARGLHLIYGLLMGFGYRPMRLMAWFVGTWLICSGVYWWAATREGVFAPSNPIVFQHEGYLSCRPGRESAWRERNSALVSVIPKEFTGPGNWYLCEALREEYTGLSPLAFSLDVLLPLVDLQQEKDWAPMIPTPKAGYLEEFTAFGWKYFTRWVIWFETLFGWVISLLLVAIVSGLTRRKE